MLAASLALTLLLSTGAAVSADKGGVSNDNACHGQTVSLLARTGNPPGKSGVNAGDYNKAIKARCAMFGPGS